MEELDVYTVDDSDVVRVISQAPKPEPGAPIPVVLATDAHVLVAYVVRQPIPADWNGSTIDEISHESKGQPIAQLQFVHPLAHMFGPPNDEVIRGHPLADRGLEPYDTFEVFGSSWLRSLVRINAVHPRHVPERFAPFRHFIFTFHDSTFECIAKGFDVSIHLGSMTTALNSLIARLD